MTFIDQGTQYKRTFFPEGRPFLTKVQQLWAVSPDNPECPLNKFIGNDKAVRCLSRAGFVAWGRHDHCCSDFSFALLGPSSTGKTTMARLFAESILLPFVEIHPQSVRSTADIFELVRDTLSNTFFPPPDQDVSMKMLPDIQGQGRGKAPFFTFTPPPIVIFVDEVHALKNDVVHGLLKATEPKDAMMAVTLENRMDCRNVLWVIATTERGLLFDAFDNRFRKITLELYSKAEIAQIIKLNQPGWDETPCQLAAHYCGRVPREAIAFADDMKAEMQMASGTWEQVAARVASSRRIDRFGMTHKRITILTALGQQGPISRSNLCNFVGVKEEELKKFQMPAMLASAGEEPALVTVTNRGYGITQAGLEELEKREIPHRGGEVLVSNVDRINFGEFDPDDFGDIDLEVPKEEPIEEKPVVTETVEGGEYTPEQAEADSPEMYHILMGLNWSPEQAASFMKPPPGHNYPLSPETETMLRKALGENT